MSSPPVRDPRLLTDQFRERTAKMVMFNYSQRNCSGCRKRRSIGQFAAGSTVCMQCVRRAA